MAQSYFTPRLASSVNEACRDAVFVGPNVGSDRQLKVEDVQEAYIQDKDNLLAAIDYTKSVLNEIRIFNRDEWVIRYPQLREKDEEDLSSTHALCAESRHALSFVDDPTNETDVHLHSSKGLSRPIKKGVEVVGEENSPDDESVSQPPKFNVLRLDLKLGPHLPSSAAALVLQLEKASIAKLLDERIANSINHIEKLKLRVQDTSSKVLVTGDLNAGKSTFVNALLRREVMPVDQQPCTTAFCEVHDAADNEGIEEIHIIKDGVKYDVRDASTYSRAHLSELEAIVTDNEHTQRMIKLYLADSRAPSESLLNNGVVDISLIDAPGLNRDSLKTTAVFARQEEIDVVVFVVSAENHFTLSAKEFLQTASNEKAFIFIVVNKYDQIRNKEKCRRGVLEQVREFSPRTYEDAQDLVHFVDSASALQPFIANPAFDDLERSLRSFVLVKRSKSKLHPVATYLCNLLSDIQLLAGANAVLAESELLDAQEDLSESRPVLDKLKRDRQAMEDALESVEESGAGEASARTKELLNDALERVAQGQAAIEAHAVPMPSYPGVLGIWDYVREVRRALLASLDATVLSAQDEARLIATQGVDKIKDLAEDCLPAGVERNRRVFMPEAMFSATRRGGRGIKRRSYSGSNSSGAVVAGGLYGLGIGLAQRHDMLETSFFDIWDINHQILVHFGDDLDGKEDTTPTALGLVSVGVGALTMVGGQALGLRGLIEGVVHITPIIGNETARKWIAPVLGACTIGLTVYLILDLRNSIPRTVGRRIKTSLVSQSQSGTQREVHFVDGHASRISRETRKVLRLASWDLKERHRGAVEGRAREIKGAEAKEKRALKAKEWFSEVGQRTSEIKVKAKLEDIGA